MRPARGGEIAIMFLVCALYPDDEPSVFGPFDNRDKAEKWIRDNQHRFESGVPLVVTELLDPKRDMPLRRGVI
jgi:hypothetical protein